MKLPVKDIYILWLSGLSIRKIARVYGVGRTSVHNALVKAYGKDACTLRKQSLARVVFKEYGDLELASRAMGVEGLYRSSKTENYYSKFQSLKPMRDLTYEDNTAKTHLRLSYYTRVSRLTTRLIYLTMMSRMNRLTDAAYGHYRAV